MSKETGQPKTFICRAECYADAARALEAMLEIQLVSFNTNKPDPNFPDVEVEIKAFSTLEEIKGVLARVEDGHRMEMTLTAISRHRTHFL